MPGSDQPIAALTVWYARYSRPDGFDFVPRTMTPLPIGIRDVYH
jgi:hypothetical protein